MRDARLLGLYVSLVEVVRTPCEVMVETRREDRNDHTRGDVRTDDDNMMRILLAIRYAMGRWPERAAKMRRGFERSQRDLAVRTLEVCA